VRSMASLEELRGLAGGVGRHELVAPPLCLFEQRQLGAGVRFLAAGDDPQVGWPVRNRSPSGCSRSRAVSSTTLACSGLRGWPSMSTAASKAWWGTRLMAARSRGPSSQPML
jgi:hypothetical protein